jgi:hypothetical protein
MHKTMVRRNPDLSKPGFSKTVILENHDLIKPWFGKTEAGKLVSWAICLCQIATHKTPIWKS